MFKVVPYTPASNDVKHISLPLIRKPQNKIPKQNTGTVLPGMFPLIISNKKDESSIIPHGFEGSCFFS